MHCPEYEHMTIEEKLLIDEHMKEWATKNCDNIGFVPNIIYDLAEERIIERLKRKEANDRRNRKQSAS